MKRKKTAVPAVEPVTSTEGVIDLEAERPTMVPSPQTQWEAGVAELNADNPTTPKPKRKYTRRAKTIEASAVKPLADANRIYEKAVEVFRMYFNNEINQETFTGRIADLKIFQTLAIKLNDSEYGK